MKMCAGCHNSSLERSRGVSPAPRDCGFRVVVAMAMTVGLDAASPYAVGRKTAVREYL